MPSRPVAPLAPPAAIAPSNVPREASRPARPFYRTLDPAALARAQEQADALTRAVRMSQTTVIERLLADGVDPDVPGTSGLLPLAALNNQAERAAAVLERLLQAGAHVNATGARGNTPLCSLLLKTTTSRETDVASLQALLDAGASPMAIGVMPHGAAMLTVHPLEMTVLLNDEPAFELLLTRVNRGLDPFAAAPFSACTALHRAAGLPNKGFMTFNAFAERAVQRLVALGADPYAPNRDQQSPLDLAVAQAQASGFSATLDTLRRAIVDRERATLQAALGDGTMPAGPDTGGTGRPRL